MKKTFVLMLLLAIFINQKTYAQTEYCAVPPFVTAGLKPNVLIILDNSNSMDEDFYGNAVGSYASSSKSVVAKKTLLDLINKLKRKLRIGLMTYKLGSGVASYHLHNSPYFVSYEPKSYCPNPPPECTEYCKTDNTEKKNICDNVCKTQNSLFDATYRDEIITYYPIGSSERNKYCNLIYPKTQALINPSNTSLFIYTKQALPFYANSDQGNGFCYSSSYKPAEGTPYDTYACYGNKTNTSDDNTGYSSLFFTGTLYPTDSDIALGYFDFGRRLSWYHTGRTWYLNTSPGNGYLHVNVNDLVDENDIVTSNYTSLVNKLDPKENDEDGYMSCTNSDKNTCPYIINAGLTPIAGTIQSAIDYFKGTDSPIQEWCQKNFVILVTDGLPSVDESGNAKSADDLMPVVLSKIDSLRSLKNKEYTFDIKTYVVGVGLTQDAKNKLDPMAQRGGTDVDGKAYYADNPEQLMEALNKIFLEILGKAASGTAASVLTEKATRGASVLQAVFYPEKYFTSGKKVEWIGRVLNYWFYISKTTQNLREDSNENKILDITNNHDYIIDFKLTNVGELKIDAFKSNTDGSQGSLATTYNSLDEIHKIFDVGEKLRDKNAASRNVYAYTGNDLKPSSPSNLVNIDGTNANLLSTYLGSLSNTCLLNPTNLIEYLRGNDITNCRKRDTGSGIWKLGDIIYSTPKVVDYGDYSVFFVGANDGMLHAFRLGKIRKDNLSGEQVARICDNNQTICTTTKLGEELWAFIPRHVMPYLKYLADTKYCHLYFVDLPPYIIEEDINNDTIIDRRILIGGLRFGAACGCNKKSGNKTVWCDDNMITPPDCSSTNPANCLGLSSYFALDITDKENPKFLWEFTDPYLGFSYSGPAFIKRAGDKYVMFASGPNDYDGKVYQSLNLFILKLKSDYTIDTIYKIDGEGKSGFTKNNSLSSYSLSFAGRLMTNGIDYNADGNTDLVLFGVNQKTGSVWQGNVLAVKPNNSSPTNWEIYSIFNSAIKPVTAKVEHMNCFGMNYIYFGTGRWFFKNDEPGQNVNDVERLYGIRIDGCLQGNNCSINSAHSSNEACGELQKNNLTSGWVINQELLPIGDYYKERTITDPTTSTFNSIFFTTMQPRKDVCGYGGRTRIWGLNCALGLSLSDTSCPGYVVEVPNASLLLQLSGGNIEQISTTEIKTSKTSNWYEGVPPETGTPLVPPYTSKTGKIILWIEK